MAPDITSFRIEKRQNRGAQRPAFALRNYSKTDFSASPPVASEVVLRTWVNKRIGTETRLWEARRRFAAQQEVVERGSEKSPTTSNGARFLAAMGQVNACEENNCAQNFGETEALTEEDDARDHTGERDQVLVDQDPVGTDAAYAPLPDPIPQSGGKDCHVANSDPRRSTYRLPLPVR